ncbi:DNA polymerase III subunit delta' [Marinobacterium nitratireducens]|uniref:DNA polymerase III subunit delta' n=1 Tax=Marinobacterium nitratireducens TaxID=518897 RepID=A0A917ZQ36_9GAMM|nr:DNA polymerase III subunit delta' [Marinobacterium nitratireducens]GGO87058.1 DNA polymerase III subunit delta' [Marinobacterium nitratireducens]
MDEARSVEVYPWLQERWRHVTRLHEAGRLPHALIVSGVQGIGKRAFAGALARYLLCQAPRDGEACGRCRSCVLHDSSGHPDLYELQPEEPGKPIRIDQVRELTVFLHSTAQQGGYRLVVLEPAEAMNVSAANALLKTLEEPGRETVLLLVSHRLGQVMPTIRSRCQRIDCHPPVPDLAAEWLAGRLQIDAAEARQLLGISLGSPIRALEYVQQDLVTLRRKFLAGLADILKQRRSALEVAQQLSKEDLELLLGWLYGWILDIVRVGATGDESYLRHTDVRNMLLAVARRAGPHSLYRLADLVHEERLSLMQRQNPNRQLLLERILLRWSELAIKH